MPNYNNQLKILLFIIVSVHTNTAMPQHKPGIYNNQIKLSPLRLIDPVHSGIGISYERRHTTNYATQLSIAYFIRNNFTRAYENYNGYRLGIEEKYFLPRSIRNKYLSAEVIYQKNSFGLTSYFIHDSSGTSPSFQYLDTVKINRRAAIINLRIGRQFMLGRFVSDISIGIGVRFRKVTHEDKLYPGDKLPGPRHPNIHYEANREKNDVALNLPLNVMIGWAF